MIGKPPVDAGGRKVTTAVRAPLVAVTSSGADGTPVGVTGADGALGAELPAAFDAVAVNVYATPAVRFVTTNGDAAPTVTKPPGLEVTVYDEIGSPPLEAGGESVTVA